MIKLFFVFIMIIGLVSCGGGGGGGDSASPAQLNNDQVDRIVAELNGKRIENVGRLDSVSN